MLKIAEIQEKFKNNLRLFSGSKSEKFQILRIWEKLCIHTKKCTHFYIRKWLKRTQSSTAQIVKTVQWWIFDRGKWISPYTVKIAISKQTHYHFYLNCTYFQYESMYSNVIFLHVEFVCLCLTLLCYTNSTFTLRKS